MRGDLNLCIVMLEELKLSLLTPLPYKHYPCVAELRRETTEPDQGFVRCQTWRECILVLVFKINKDVMSFFFPNHCSMWLNLCFWSYDDVIQIIISFLFDYHCLICVHNGLRKVYFVLQVSWSERSKRRIEEKAWTSLQLVRCGSFSSLKLAYICLLNIVHLSFNPSMLMAS